MSGCLLPVDVVEAIAVCVWSTCAWVAAGQRAHRELPEVGADDHPCHRACQSRRGHRRHLGEGQEGETNTIELCTVV